MSWISPIIIFYVIQSFYGHYQMFYAMSPSQLSTLFEAQLVRFFLVEKALMEKCVETLERMKSKVSNMSKRTWEGGVVLK